jgi:mortality factor 4-like protein 1
MGSSYAVAKDESEDSGDAKTETGKFREGEKVLAYHGPLIYDTKIQKAEFRKKEWKYFVHYLGWSKNWDEWVGADRLMKPTDENLEKQKKLFKNQTGDKQTKGRVPAGKQKSTVEKELITESKLLAPRGKKRKSDPVAEAKDSEESDHLLKICLPGTLKRQLVEDWDFITQMGKLVKLPRSPSAEDILKKYIDFRTKRDGAVEDSLMEMLNGLRIYFDKSLPAMLLYPQERAQYASAVPQGSTISPSSIYGAEHLLRLFVKLSELLVYTNMEHEALTQLQQKLADFLKFLQRNQGNFFLTSYD